MTLQPSILWGWLRLTFFRYGSHRDVGASAREFRRVSALVNRTTLAGLAGTGKDMMKRLSALLISAVLLSACDGGGRPPTAPSVPTPDPTPSPAPAPTTPVVTYTLSGTIFEVMPTGRVPIRVSESTVMAVGARRVTPKLTPMQTASTALSGHRMEPLPSLVGKAG